MKAHNNCPRCVFSLRILQCPRRHCSAPWPVVRCSDACLGRTENARYFF